MPVDHISVRGAREHNLKNVSVDIPRDKLVVITGLSGSGKSSLAFDTIYAEGQRRYVESLSAYARQFLGLMEKPDVDHIDGLSPAISIDQKGTSNNPRSTVGTVTEIYDYMRLLWARAGRPHCPKCGRPIEKQTVQQIVDATLAYPPGSRLLLLAPVARAKKGEHAGIFDEARRAGFVRVRIDGEVLDLDESIALDKKKRHDIDVVVDRLVVPEPGTDPTATSRIADSVETALKVGQGVMIVALAGGRPPLRGGDAGTAGGSLGSVPTYSDGPTPPPVVVASRAGGGATGASRPGAENSDSDVHGLTDGTADGESDEPSGEDGAEATEAESIASGKKSSRSRVAAAGASSPVATRTALQEAGLRTPRATRSAGRRSELRTQDSALSTPTERLFSEHFSCPYDGSSIGEIEPRTFSFNSPHGACPKCTGLGVEMQIDPTLIIPDRTKSLRDGAIEPWAKTASVAPWYARMLEGVAEYMGFSPDTPVKDLPEAQLDAVLYGTGDRVLPLRFTNQHGRTQAYDSKFEGVIRNLDRRYKETDSDWVRGEIEKYMGSIPCPDCKGRRLRPEALAVLIGTRSIVDVTNLSITDAHEWAEELAGPATPLNVREQTIAVQILKEIRGRLQFLVDVGLDYLTLDRVSGTLSGGESQRIRLATQIGSALMGVLYICDEPSIGLHPIDGDRLIATLVRLKDLGNTVLIVEHDEAMMRAADWIIDMGPGAGIHGGYVVAEGDIDAIKASEASLTGAYLSGRREIAVPRERRAGNGKRLLIRNAHENNLRHLDIEIPLGKFVAVTGVSGSGKSSLITEILVKRAAQVLNGARQRPGLHDVVEGLEQCDKIVDIDQSPIGRTPRSNPATYTGMFTIIRDMFASVPEAKARGYKAGRFSFNVKGGRCEECTGDGYKVIQMQFLPDVTVPCEVCQGKRYNREALEILFRGKSIAEVLNMTVSEAAEFFERFPRVKRILDTLEATGLGYVHLGQPATTLSGGEAQRIKLASELSRRSTGRTLYILDEPTTGLSFQDVAHLLHVLQRLADSGNTVIVIEHHLDVIKAADHLIDLGPQGGTRGGQLVATGTPEEVARIPESYTGQYLRPILEAAGTMSTESLVLSPERRSTPPAKLPASGKQRRVRSDSNGVEPAGDTRDDLGGRVKLPGATAEIVPNGPAHGSPTAEPTPNGTQPSQDSGLSTQDSPTAEPVANDDHAAQDSVLSTQYSEGLARAAAAVISRIERESVPEEPRAPTKAAQKRARQAANPRKETSSERALREKREGDGAPGGART